MIDRLVCPLCSAKLSIHTTYGGWSSGICPIGHYNYDKWPHNHQYTHFVHVKELIGHIYYNEETGRTIIHRRNMDNDITVCCSSIEEFASFILTKRYEGLLILS